MFLFRPKEHLQLGKLLAVFLDFFFGSVGGLVMPLVGRINAFERNMFSRFDGVLAKKERARVFVRARSHNNCRKSGF
jgi:hypothetical protein